MEDVLYHDFTAVLVAHNGNNFDFPLLLAEIRRTPELCTSTLVQQNILFADTLPFLKKVSHIAIWFEVSYHYNMVALRNFICLGKSAIL